MSKQRVPIAKRIRFEVFKRDSFTCQYCGRKSPEVILHVDHIDPVSRGGDNEILNLITSCVDCNLGKSDKRLSESDAIQKQRAQLDELNRRREQMEMMVKWAEDMRSLDQTIAAKVIEHWQELLKNQFWVNESGETHIRKLLRRFTPDKVMEAMQIAFDRYVKVDSLNKFTNESVNLAWGKIAGITYLKNGKDDNRDLYYVRGILRNRLGYLNEGVMWTLLNSAREAGATGQEMIAIAKQSNTWTSWRADMDVLISDLSMGG